MGGPGPENSLDQLLEFFSERGELEQTSTASYLLRRFRNISFDPPLELRVTRESLDAYLAEEGDSSDTEDLSESAFGLLLVNLEEKLFAPGLIAYIAIGPDRLDAPMLREDPAYVREGDGDLNLEGGPYAWLMHPPDDPKASRSRSE